MLNFKKVLKEGSNEKSFLSGKKKKDQENYENKVKDFLKIGASFKSGVERRLSLDDTVGKFTQEFKNAFGPLMTMREMAFSHTSRVLGEMHKNLKKLNKNAKISDSIAEIEKALKYTPKTSSGDYVKRSSIDNPKVVNYFKDVVDTLKTKFSNVK